MIRQDQEFTEMELVKACLELRLYRERINQIVNKYWVSIDGFNLKPFDLENNIVCELGERYISLNNSKQKVHDA